MDCNFSIAYPQVAGSNPARRNFFGLFLSLLLIVHLKGHARESRVSGIQFLLVLPRQQKYTRKSSSTDIDRVSAALFLRDAGDRRANLAGKAATIIRKARHFLFCLSPLLSDY